MTKTDRDQLCPSFLLPCFCTFLVGYGMMLIASRNSMKEYIPISAKRVLLPSPLAEGFQFRKLQRLQQPPGERAEARGEGNSDPLAESAGKTAETNGTDSPYFHYNLVYKRTFGYFSSARKVTRRRQRRFRNTVGYRQKEEIPSSEGQTRAGPGGERTKKEAPL